jgi:hypothetical protein
VPLITLSSPEVLDISCLRVHMYASECVCVRELESLCVSVSVCKLD